MTDNCETSKPKDCRYCYCYGRHGCKESSVIHQNPQLTLNLRPRQFQCFMVGDNRKGLAAAKLIFQPCASI